MKNRLFSVETILGVVVSFLLCSSNASAQSYLGGSFNFGGSSSNSSIGIDSQTRQNFSVQVAPDFGWFVGDRWAVGIRPRVGFSLSPSVVRDNIQSRNSSLSLGINPYARYRLLALHRFGLWAEADPELAFTQTQSKVQVQGQESTSNHRSTTYSLGIVPVLTFLLNSHISLESRLNLFSFRLQGTHDVSGNNDVQNSFSWGLQATTKNVMDALGNISIGFLYKF